MTKTSGCTRREWLKHTAAGLVLGPAILRASALGAAGRPAPSNRVVLAGIGMGGQGSGDLGSFIGNPAVQVTHVCDVDYTRLQKIMKTVDTKYSSPGACKGTQDFREVVGRTDIDAVLIATPDHWHTPIAIAAAKSGKDVYCEKPMSLTIGGGRAAVDACTRYGRVFQCGSQQRSSREFRLACELVRNGRIGKIKHVDVGIPGNNKSCPPTWTPEPVPQELNYDLWLGPAPWEPYTLQRCHYTFRFLLDYSGGQVTNWGAHHLDIAQWGLGMDDTGPVQIEGRGAFPQTGLFTVASRVDFTCTYANGITLRCKTGGGAKVEGEEGLGGGTRFIGESGWIHVNRGKLEASSKAILDDPIKATDVRLYESKDHKGNFIDCCISRKPTICTAEIGHRSASMCHLGNIAMLLNRTVKWDPAAERFIGDDDANRMIDRTPRVPYDV